MHNRAGAVAGWPELNRFKVRRWSIQHGCIRRWELGTSRGNLVITSIFQ